MKKVSLLVIILAIMLVSLVGCSYVSVITNDPLNLRVELDNSIPLLTGDNSEELLGNIDRGFRLETYYTLGSGRAWPTDDTSDGFDMLNDEIAFYAADKANIIQVYIYLSEYSTKPLDDLAFIQMKVYFNYIRSLNMSMLLRFAYDHSQGEGNWVSPKQDVLLGHLAQIKEFMATNVDLINDTVTAYQFGVIGAWGEWGATGAKYNEKTVLEALVDMMPSGTYYQGRYTRVTDQLVKNGRYDYVGYHNDFLVARPHPWNTAADKYKSKQYKTFRERNKYTINDGEMPWGGHTEEPNEVVDGKKFIAQMMEHRMTTLSIKHNYLEKEGTFNIERYKSEYVTAADIKALNCPYYDEYFMDSQGNAINRSVYEYLRDFLGYNLALSNLKVEDGGRTIKLVITNFGMSAPLTLDDFSLVIAGDGVQEKNVKMSVNTRELITAGQVEVSVTLDQPLANERVGVRITRNNSAGNYYIKTANNIPYNGGVNWIK